jgi:hypothetical protein
MAGGVVLGLATPLAVVPGSTFLGMAPFAAVAEGFLQARRALGKTKGLASKPDLEAIYGLSRKMLESLYADWNDALGEE